MPRSSPCRNIPFPSFSDMNRRPVLLPSASLSSPEFGPFLLYAPPDARNSDARIGPLKVDRIAVVYGRHHIVDLVPERIGVKAHAAAVVLHLICALVRSLRVLAHEIDRVGACHQTVVAVIYGIGECAGDGNGGPGWGASLPAPPLRF